MHEVFREANELKKEGATRNDLRNILDTDSQLRRYIDSFALKEGLLREEHKTYGNNIVPLYFKTDHAKRMYHFFFFSFSFLAGLSSIVNICNSCGLHSGLLFLTSSFPLSLSLTSPTSSSFSLIHFTFELRLLV